MYKVWSKRIDTNDEITIMMTNESLYLRSLDEFHLAGVVDLFNIMFMYNNLWIFIKCTLFNTQTTAPVRANTSTIADSRKQMTPRSVPDKLQIK